MSEALFALSGLSKRFPSGKEALSRIDLDIFEGECLVIAGSNGSGKTVLMHILAALSRPSSGSLLFRGEALPQAERRIRAEVGLVFQDADAQLLGETVASDIAWGLRERARLSESPGRDRESLQTTRRQSRSDFEALLARETARCMAACGLTGKEEAAPGTLSGGEKRRLAVAGILATGSRCIIMDEPFANLDWPGIRQVLIIIRDLKAAGHTLIVLTHELEKVLAHADRLVILDSGRIRDAGKPLEVLERGVAAWGIRDPRHRYERVEDCTWLD